MVVSSEGQHAVVCLVFGKFIRELEKMEDGGIYSMCYSEQSTKKQR